MKHIKLFELNDSTYDNFYLKKAIKLGKELYNYDYTNKDMNIIFDIASRYGHIEILKLLLRGGVDNTSGEGNKFITNASIGHASEKGHIETVKLLLNDERVDPSVDGNYAIGLASVKGYIEIVRLLLSDDRVDPSDDNNYAIIGASRKGHTEIVKILAKDKRVQDKAGLTETELLKKYLK